MATPKKRHTPTRTKKRRSHHALKNTESMVHGMNHRLNNYYKWKRNKAKESAPSS